ncbi:MurR/RpiR family transcriptional regulator [Lihuaxuella thermophila]|uniref:DNA-binding transcriptional regulator, MurR/RpiR family, contains HTH and SIS domains n=1 Tax=Lihuaxuella thermophila TaxID=1173111 RepID=A0A1H8IPN7_9BACL|nr:MurR/RpiR family transcriptional regulator [Lihuaxuella thermophila]SEN69957.1 DNA-binding transcriptional regulator, MurR/RpiR family, contains HTH and SIS domains [Lihuaxuella thermophila]
MNQQSKGIAYIRASYPYLSPKFQAIVDHILEHPRDVVHLSISELAELTKCSEATIFRLCKQLGFRGYQDLKISLAREVVDQPVQHIHEEIQDDDDMITIARKVFQANIIGINDTMQLLEPESLQEAVEWLDQAQRVEFYATGGSAPIAQDAYHKFIRTGLNCIAHSDAHLQVMSASLLNERCVVVGISHSGSNVDILESFQVAKQSGAKLIAITSYKKSQLAQLADLSLYTSTRETAFRTEAMSARIAQLCIIDALYVGLSMKRQEETLKNLDRIRRVISNKRI